jgi:mannose-6-phosphate isomerase-like protein (cupin superfamily)
MIKTSIDQLKFSETRILAEYFGSMPMTEFGVKKFDPAEKPQQAHTHHVNEVLIILQGKGEVSSDGKVYPVKTGDVIILKPGEDHRTQSSEGDPLVAVWFCMER